MGCNQQQQHKVQMAAIQNSMDVLNGKWKIAILSSLCYYNKRRFSDILIDVSGISNKMLSKELKDLEINRLIKRIVISTRPITIYYELTDHGMTLKAIIDNLTEWGIAHRQKIIADYHIA